MTRIYLDTNQWIKLLSIQQGKVNDEQLKKIFAAIKKLTKSDDIKVVFSIFTLEEIWKHSDKEKRDNLIDLIIDISKGYVLKPFDIFLNKEIENAVYFVLENKYIHDIYSEILGKGLADLVGYSFEKMNQENPIKWNLLKNNSYGIPEEFFREDFQKFSEDLDVLRKNLKDRKSEDVINTQLEGIKKHLKDLEEYRFKNSDMSKEMFSRYIHARGFIDSIIPHLTIFLHSREISPEKIFEENGKKKYLIFKEHLKSFNVFSILCLERDFGAEKQIISNDVFDMAHLSGAIPYCDVIVTEHMFAHISKIKKLDKMYDCVILDDLRYLSNIEPIKSKIKKIEMI